VRRFAEGKGGVGKKKNSIRKKKKIGWRGRCYYSGNYISGGSRTQRGRGNTGMVFRNLWRGRFIDREKSEKKVTR